MGAFKYRIITEWSDEDEVFVARVPALGPACTAHGDSPELAAKEARTAAEAMLDVMHEDGDALPDEDASADYSGQLRLRLPKSMHEQVARLAAADEVSLNTTLVALISEAMAYRTRARIPKRPRGSTRRTTTSKPKAPPPSAEGSPLRKYDSYLDELDPNRSKADKLADE